MQAELAEYLCDENYEEISIEDIPTNLDREQAVENIRLYINLLVTLHLEKNFCWKPRDTTYSAFVSHETMPRLLTERIPMTVLEFLCKKSEDNLQDALEKVEYTLRLILDVIPKDQISVAYCRLNRLCDIVEFEEHE